MQCNPGGSAGRGGGGIAGERWVSFGGGVLWPQKGAEKGLFEPMGNPIFVVGGGYTPPFILKKKPVVHSLPIAQP